MAASKGFKDEEALHRDTNESLQRKISLLESELDVAEKNLKDTTEKCACPQVSFSCGRRTRLTRVAMACGVG